MAEKQSPQAKAALGNKDASPEDKIATSYDKGQPDAAPTDPPKVANEGVKQTATSPMQPMTDVSIPDPVALAAGLQSENGATPVGFYSGPEPDAEKVSLSGAFAKQGELGGYLASKTVYERFLAPKTVTPQNRLVAAEGSPITATQYQALLQAEKNL